MPCSGQSTTTGKRRPVRPCGMGSLHHATEDHNWSAFLRLARHTRNKPTKNRFMVRLVPCISPKPRLVQFQSSMNGSYKTMPQGFFIKCTDRGMFSYCKPLPSLSYRNDSKLRSLNDTTYVYYLSSTTHKASAPGCTLNHLITLAILIETLPTHHQLPPSYARTM